MKSIREARLSRKVKLASGILGIALAFAFATVAVRAQAPVLAPKPCSDCPPARPTAGTVQTFYLTNAGSQADANEILTALRNIVAPIPNVKVILVASQNAIIVEGTSDQLAVAQRLISDLDRPKKSYRLTYIITEKDANKRIDTQHFTAIVVPGQRMLLKQGSRVPVLQVINKPESGSENQVAYLEVGLQFDATFVEAGNGGILRTRIDQSSVADEKSGIGPQNPIFHQAYLESSSSLTLGKSSMLGSLDIPGTTRHLDVEATIELAQ